MSYTVFIKVGKSQMGSIPLPNKIRVCNYIKRNPLARGKTKIEVTNLRNNKITYGTSFEFCSKFSKLNW